jgi:polysaccharide export outer membrane protein
MRSPQIVEWPTICADADVSTPGRAGLPSTHDNIAGHRSLGRLRYHTLENEHPIQETADLRRECESLRTGYAKEQAHLRRLKQELG